MTANSLKKVLITTVPFANKSLLPIQLLEEAGISYTINPLGRKLSEEELAELVSDFDALIAGTEQITEKVFDRAKNLQFISRVGIGLDGVDLLAAKQRKIQISYTPDAPAPAVAELTIGLMLALMRNIHVSNSQMHRGEWYRHFGRRIPEITIGIIGAGRIGVGVIKRLQSLEPSRILVNDINPILGIDNYGGVEIASKSRIYQDADLISLHLPLTNQTKNLICYNELKSMKPNAMIINTSRGGVINEGDLARALTEGHLAGAAIDVFEREPYSGVLKNIERCLLTAHMGSMSEDCRVMMEIEATKEVVRFFAGQKLQSVVPLEEYDSQQRGCKQ